MKEHPFNHSTHLPSSIYDHRDYLITSSHHFTPLYPSTLPKPHSHSSYLQIHSNRIISALKRDQIKPHNHDLSQYSDNSFLFPESGMSHKRYLTQIQGKLLNSGPKHNNFSLNHSATFYPYSFTQYQKMKGKIQERSQAEDHWLQSELSRIKRQDQLIEAKQKMKKTHETPYLPLKIQNKRKVKQIFHQVRDQLKPTHHKTFDPHFSETNKKTLQKSYLSHSFIEEKPTNSQVKANIAKNLSVLSSDSKDKNCQKKEKCKNIALNQIISHHVPIKRLTTQKSQKKQRKSQPRDRYRYVSETSEPDLENSQAFKSQHLNQLDLSTKKPSLKREKLKTTGDQKVTEDMIDRAFAFDDLKECKSDYEEEDLKKVQKQIQTEKQIKNSKNTQGYKDTLEIVYEGLFKTPERLKHEPNFEAGKQSGKSTSKKDQRYNQLLVSIERKKLQSKTFMKPSFKAASQNRILSSSLINLSSPQSPNENQQNIQSCKQIQIYPNKSAIDNCPAFSPYVQHKQLPNEYLTTSLERRKPPKLHSSFAGTKKQYQTKNFSNIKDLIVDEIEKKKIANKKQHETLKPNQTSTPKNKIMEPILTSQQHLLSSQGQKTPKNPNTTTNLNSYSNSQTVAKNLRIELQILKQQLVDKNRKVVDLEIEIMQMKTQFHQKKSQLEDETTTSKSKPSNEQSRKDFTISKDNSSQTEKLSSQIESSNKKQTTLSKSHLIQTQPKPQLKLFSQKFQYQILPNNTTTKDHPNQVSKVKNQLKILQTKLYLQEEAMNNLFEDLGMYQKINQDLQTKIKNLENQKSQNL